MKSIKIMPQNKVIALLKKELPYLASKYNVKKIGVFGSYAKGEGKTVSDIDVLVEFKKTVDTFEFLDLKEYLERLLGREVDLITKRALKPLIKDRILTEIVYV